MTARLVEQLAALSTMSTAELPAEWERVHRAPAPKLPPDLLRISIAYRRQERALGGLSRASASVLRREGTGAPQMKPGTRLVRSWNGRSIAVLVVEEGFEFEGGRYRSLTAIAREVTGAGWSGPRFFGLTDSDG
jgi:hypothetical protein